MARVQFTICLATVFAIVAGNSLHADESIKRFFDRLADGGTWELIEPKGKGYEDTYRSALGGAFIVYYGKPNAFGIVGTDPNTEQLTWWVFRDDGSVHVSAGKTLRSNDQSLAVQFDGENGDRATLDIEYPKPKQIEVNAEGTLGGFDFAGEMKRTLWRETDEIGDLSWLEAKSGTGELARQKMLKEIEGFHSVRGTDTRGLSFHGASNGRWILGGSFFWYTGTWVNEGSDIFSHQLVCGVDPETGNLTAWEFSSEGAVSRFNVVEDGNSLRGSGINPDGTRYTFQGKMESVGEAYTYNATMTNSDGETLPYEWSYHSVPDKPGK